MKAVRLTQVGHPLELQEIPVPEIGPKDVLVRVKAAGICHSDVHYRAVDFDTAGSAERADDPRVLVCRVLYIMPVVVASFCWAFVVI